MYSRQAIRLNVYSTATHRNPPQPIATQRHPPPPTDTHRHPPTPTETHLLFGTICSYGKGETLLYLEIPNPSYLSLALTLLVDMGPVILPKKV